MTCQWLCLSKGCKCRYCGYALKRDYPKAPIRGCRAPQPEAPKLGDRLETMLAAIHITEEGYKRAKELFGLPPDCNCPERKAWLNKVSDWWRGEGD